MSDIECPPKKRWLITYQWTYLNESAPKVSSTVIDVDPAEWMADVNTPAYEVHILFAHQISKTAYKKLEKKLE